MQEDGCLTGNLFQLEKEVWRVRVSELRRLRQLEEENYQLKKLVADLSLDKQMLQDVIKKSFKTCFQKAIGCMATRSISGVCQKSLYGRHTGTLNVLLSAYSQRRWPIAFTHEGDCTNAYPLWFLAHIYIVKTRRVYGQSQACIQGL